MWMDGWMYNYFTCAMQYIGIIRYGLFYDINAGLMVPNGRDKTALKPLRSKRLPLLVDPKILESVTQGVQKMRTFQKDVQNRPYVLLYSDYSEVIRVCRVRKFIQIGWVQARMKKSLILGSPFTFLHFLNLTQRHGGAVVRAVASQQEGTWSSRAELDSQCVYVTDIIQ